MTRTIKAILLLILLLTLPLRGFSAVMLVAGPVHAHDAMAASQMDAESMMAHHHGHGANHHDDGSHHEKHADSCSTCGACCTGAMSGAIYHKSFLSNFTASQPVALLNHPYAGFIPEGPERPPQTSLH